MFNRGVKGTLLPRGIKCFRKKYTTLATILLFSLLLVFHQWIVFQHVATLPSLDDYSGLGDIHNLLVFPHDSLGNKTHHTSWKWTTAAVPMPQADFGLTDTIVAPRSLQSAWGPNKNLQNGNGIHIDNPMDNVIWSSDFQLSVPFHLSGCEPKLEIIYYNTSHTDLGVHDKRDRGSTSRTKYIFKPAQSTRKALNELIAYYVDQLFHFYRVPPVAPVQIPLYRIIPETTANVLSRHQSFWKCAMDFSKKWVMKNHTPSMIIPSSNSDAHRNYDRSQTVSQQDQHDRNLDVFGTVQIKVPGVKQRSELVRWVDRMLTPSSSTMQNNSILTKIITLVCSFLRSSLFPKGSNSAQRERGTRALFDFLIHNSDRFNNNFVIPQKAQSSSDSKQKNNYQVFLYIDNNLLEGMWDLPELTRECRFYQQPVERLFNVTNPKTLLFNQLKSHHGELLDQWMYDHLGGGTMYYHTIRFLDDLEWRIQVVRQRIAECIVEKGYNHVFVD